MQRRAKADPHLLVRALSRSSGPATSDLHSFEDFGEAWATSRLSLHFLKAIHSGHLSMCRWSSSVLSCPKGKGVLSVLLPAKCLSSTGKHGVESRSFLRP